MVQLTMKVAAAVSLVLLVACGSQQLEPEAEKPSPYNRVNVADFIPTFGALQMPETVPSECPRFTVDDGTFYTTDTFADGTLRDITVGVQRSGKLGTIRVRMGPSDDRFAGTYYTLNLGGAVGERDEPYLYFANQPSHQYPADGITTAAVKGDGLFQHPVAQLLSTYSEKFLLTCGAGAAAAIDAALTPNG